MLNKNVPFIGDRPEKYASCQGPPTTMMVLRSFGIDLSFEELYKKMKYQKGRWFFESYIVELLTSFKIPCKYYSNEHLRKIGNDHGAFKRLSGIDLNNKNRKEFDVEHYDAAAVFVLEHGLFEKSRVDTDFIIKQLDKGKLVIAVVDRNKLTGSSESEYKGHFILVKGFGKGAFVCNDAYFGENIRITAEKFKEAFYCIDYVNKSKSHHVIIVG